MLTKISKFSKKAKYRSRITTSVPFPYFLLLLQWMQSGGTSSFIQREYSHIECWILLFTILSKKKIIERFVFIPNTSLTTPFILFLSSKPLAKYPLIVNSFKLLTIKYLLKRIWKLMILELDNDNYSFTANFKVEKKIQFGISLKLKQILCLFVCLL